MKKRTTRMRELLEHPDILVMPGTHDSLGGMLAEAAGFEALVSGGYSASATLLGSPDLSQLSFSEMVDYYTRLCEATRLPLLADADTGFGGIANVVRTVRGYERAGVAALLLEDQVFPKKCGHYAGKQVVSRQEWIGKIKAALDARTDPDLCIVARTDALAPHGMDEAMERVLLAQEAGADVLFVDALETRAQMERLCSMTTRPCLANVIEGGKSPELPAADLQQIGFAGVLYALAPTYAVAYALREFYAHLARHGNTHQLRDRQITFSEFNELVRLPQYIEREERARRSAEELVTHHEKRRQP